MSVVGLVLASVVLCARLPCHPIGEKIKRRAGRINGGPFLLTATIDWHSWAGQTYRGAGFDVS